MAPKKGPGKSSKLSGDALWRAPVGEKPIPRISSSMLSVRQPPNFAYATSIMKHPDPIGMGLACEAYLEPAGPECLIPGQQKPVKILGLRVWPVDVPDLNLKALEPLGREMQTFGKMLDKAFDLMQAPFNER